MFSFIFQSFATDLTSGCGSEKQCFLVPEGCSGSACEFVVTWTPRGDLIDFVVRANVAGLGDNVWVSMGINPNAAMVSDPMAKPTTINPIQFNSVQYNSIQFLVSPGHQQ